MKVLLINPPTLYTSRSGGGIDIPFGLLAIADSAKDFVDVEIFDIGVEQLSEGEVVEKIKQIQPDVVGVTCWISAFPYVRWLSQAIADLMPDVPIIGGGPFATVVPEIYLKHAKVSVVVMGEGEITFPHLLRTMENGGSIANVPGIAYVRNGEIKINRAREGLFNLHKAPRPPYELLLMDKYLSKSFLRFPFRGTSILTDRGCLYECSFCNSQYLGPYRSRSFDSVKEEVLFLHDNYGVELLFVCDAILTLTRQKTIRISRMMAELGVKWFGETRVDDVIKQQDLLPAMAQGGCVELWLGFESADEKVLNCTKKGTTVEQNKMALDLIRSVGIRPILFILLGLPGDTEVSLKKTIKFIKEERVFANPSALYVIPGTPLANQARLMGRELEPLVLAQRFYDEYFQSNRSVAFPNLSDVSDATIKEATDELWEHNRSLKNL